jgi:hypothetical protein
LVTAATEKIWLTMPNAHQGDKKKAEIVIHPLGIGLVQTASGATARCVVEGPSLGLDTGNHKKHRGVSFYNECFPDAPLMKQIKGAVNISRKSWASIQEMLQLNDDSKIRSSF